MDEQKLRSPLGELASPFAVHEGLFADVQDAKFAIRGVLRAFFGNSTQEKDDFLFFRKIKVLFAKDPEQDVEFDYRKRIIFFYFTEPVGEEAESLKAQTVKDTSIEYAIRSSDGVSRTAMAIYLSLDDRGRKALLDVERRNEAVLDSPSTDEGVL